jgi:hypothetical protein
VNVGSTAGITGSLNLERAAHTAAKGAVIALTRPLAAEGARHRLSRQSHGNDDPVVPLAGAGHAAPTLGAGAHGA